MYQPDALDWRIIEYIQEGLPLVPRPYKLLAAHTGFSETILLQRIQHLYNSGIIKRFGIVVHHRRLGYTANAMVVWDILDKEIETMAHQFTRFNFVTLCYRRPRCLPHWRYNLFTMIHAQDRATAHEHVATMEARCGEVPHEILFSRRCFKQCGARYVYRDNIQALALA
jgi:siroheme decarboxylase